MELKTNPYSGSARHSIIPPTWFKQIDEEPYKRIWGQARQELREATALVVIGYSMPPSDFFSRYLFEQETAENLGVLVVANPDRDARSRIIGSLRNSVGNRTQIIELDGLEEFADGLR